MSVRSPRVVWPPLGAALVLLAFGCGASAARSTSSPRNESNVSSESVREAPTWAPREGVLAFGSEVLIERTGLTLRLPASPLEGCRGLAVRSGGGLRDVDVTLYAADGAPLVTDDAPDAHALVEICAATPVFARIEARAGAGELTWVYFVGDAAPLRNELGIRGGHARVDEWSPLDATLRARGFTLRTERWSSRVDVGASWAAPFTLDPGRCATMAVRAEANVQLRLRLGDATIESEPGPHAALQVCAAASSRSGVLEVEADAPTVLGFARWEGREADVGGDEALWLGARSTPAEVRSER